MQAKVLKTLWYFRRSIRRLTVGIRPLPVADLQEVSTVSETSVLGLVAVDRLQEQLTNLARSAIICVAFGAIGQQWASGLRLCLCRELLLDQFGDYTATGDEVDHRYWEVAVGVGLGRDFRGIAYEALGEPVG